MHYKSHSQSSKVQKHGWRIHGSSTHVLGRCSKTRKEVISQWIHWLIIFQIPRARPAKFCIYLKHENTTLGYRRIWVFTKFCLNFRYEQTVEFPFHVSKACIEPSTSKDSVTSVYVEVDNADEFIICNLSEKVMNETLDLNFNSGDKICFKTTVNINFRKRIKVLRLLNQFQNKNFYLIG